MNSSIKQSLHSLVNTEQFTQASKKFWTGIPGNSLSNKVEFEAYDQFQSILNNKDWVILQNWLTVGDNPEWKMATVNSSSELSMATLNDHLEELINDETKSCLVVEKNCSKNNNETKPTGKGKNQKNEKSKQSDTEKNVVKSSPTTLYWSIPQSFQVKDPTDLEAINSRIELYKLKELSEKHSTLRFIGKKKNDIDLEYMKFEGKRVVVTVDGFGYDFDKIKAISLKVINIELIEDNGNKIDFPRDLMHPVQQHITYALGEGTKAVDSVKTITEHSVNGGYYKFTETLVIEGIVTRVI